jgi:hypothetical protein
MYRPVLLAFLWAAPVAFAFSFIKGYLLSPRTGPVAFWISFALALVSGVPPLLVPSLGIRIAGGVTLLLIAYCAAGMTDSQLHHNNYTGYGVIIFVPAAAVVILAQIVLALVVSLSHV